MTDLHSSPGIGGFKSAIIFMRVDTGYWQFCPLKTLQFHESNYHFRMFCKATKSEPGKVTMYCDNHATLLKMCSDFGSAARHPPPGHARRNPLIERSVYRSKELVVVKPPPDYRMYFGRRSVVPTRSTIHAAFRWRMVKRVTEISMEKNPTLNCSFVDNWCSLFPHPRSSVTKLKRP